MTPRGGADRVDGWMRLDDGRAVLKVRVAAPPADGAANEAVIALIAKALGAPRRAVSLGSGASARIKRLDLDGVTQADLVAAFGPAPGA